MSLERKYEYKLYKIPISMILQWDTEIYTHMDGFVNICALFTTHITRMFNQCIISHKLLLKKKKIT